MFLFLHASECFFYLIQRLQRLREVPKIPVLLTPTHMLSCSMLSAHTKKALLI